MCCFKIAINNNRPVWFENKIENHAYGSNIKEKRENVVASSNSKLKNEKRREKREQRSEGKMNVCVRVLIHTSMKNHILYRVMLTSVLRALVKNSIKENFDITFMGNEKKLSNH